ncbi:HAD superfamily hydrolase (TIGR01549 family) [Planomicrobium sp. HSC-17F08]|nr:HAD superfamily hydrolase (TIGR01549 family) [Planomicrobium sp. HSC-17F08]
MVQSIIFDVDGTILDTEQAILKSLQRILKEETNRAYELDELRFVLGIPGKDALTQLKISNIEAVQSKWSEAVLDFSNEVKVFNEMKEALTHLSGRKMKMGIVTSKTKQELLDEFEPFGLSNFFSQTISASDTIKHKPHPEPLLACLERLNISANEAIYIGDSIYDLQCAMAANVKFALALWGAKTLEGFEEADYVLHSPSDIASLLD